MPSKTFYRPGSGLTGLGFGPVLISAYVFVFGVFSFLAPGGQWTNQLFGVDMWLENDPGGWYFTGASELFVSSEPIFPGHPGLPLQLVLNAIQRTSYLLSAVETKGFFDHVARHLYWLYFLSKLAMVVIHLLSFGLLYWLSRRLGLSMLGAKLATLSYATSFPVLYYANRISVEPFVMVSFFATMALLFQLDDATRFRLRQKSMALAAGGLAMLGALSKAHLMAVFPLVPLAYPWLSRSRLFTAEIRRSACFWSLVGVSGTLMVSSALVDWGSFLTLWREQVGSSSELARRLTTAEWISGALSVKATAPYLFELGFALVGGFGCYRLIKEDRFGRFRWALLYGSLSTFVWAYRAVRSADFHGFHYLFVMGGVLAIGFGAGLALLAERIVVPRWQMPVGLLMVFVLHGFSLAAAYDTKQADVTSFSERNVFREALEVLPVGGRIAVIGNGYIDLVSLSGLSDSYSPLDDRAALISTFGACFLPIRRAQFTREQLVDHLRRQRVAFVIHSEGTDASVVDSFDEWRVR